MSPVRSPRLDPSARRPRSSWWPALPLVVVLSLLIASCKSSADSSASSSTGAPSTPISATIPPGYNGTLPANAPAPSAPRDTSGIEESAPTSVLPANQPLCEAVSDNRRVLAGPDKGTDDATYLRQQKDMFNRFVDTAPTPIKPEIQAMNNVVQSVNTPADVTKLLDDPTFTANQERFAVFVKDNCGFDLSG